MNHARALLVFLIAALLRFPHLADRPFHADEAVRAAKLDEPRYDPAEHHGPVLAMLTPARWQTATEGRLRAVPALAGSLLAALPGPGALYAGLLTALSPAMVWYSRDYIPEILLVLWTWLLLICGWRYSREKSARWAGAAGAAAGLMLATKETAVIALACAAIVWLRRVKAGHLLAFIAAAGAVVLFFLKPAGLAGMMEAWDTVWLPRAFGDTKHLHGPFFYLELLVRTEWPILALAAAGAWRSRRMAIYALLVLAAYSAIPYKTPWCALTALHGLALVAGSGVATLAERFGRGGQAAAACAALALLLTPAAPAWSYAETTRDAPLIRSELEQWPRETPVQVIGQENVWPLPWYLRRFPNARYLRAVPEGQPLAPLILATPDTESALVRAMYELPPPGLRFLYAPLFDRPMWLRNGVEIRGYRRP